MEPALGTQFVRPGRDDELAEQVAQAKSTQPLPGTRLSAINRGGVGSDRH
jgi:hypothetical protein|tara:strand:+ start:334 stop:483 length:150 start_codon:yes stop_codon:yes gene_type:complete